MMMSPEELREYSRAVRTNRRAVDDQLLDQIESDIQEYRAFLTEPRPQLPPDQLAQRLPLMGWLIYEASLAPLWLVTPAFEALTSEGSQAARSATEMIARAADAARSLPWPEFAPRALGAIRAQALAASKRDTERGYDDAWILHQEARTKHASFTDSHAIGASRGRYVLDLDEVLLQLALAETGTACRTAERVIGRWAEELEDENGAWTAGDSARWTQRMFRELSDAVAIGERAIEVAARIEAAAAFVHRVDEHRLALVTSYQNPGIMTARAALLMLSMCPEMEALGRRPGNHETWAGLRAELLERVERAYRHIELPVRTAEGDPLPLQREHARSIVQLRLLLALLAPGHTFPARLVFDPCLELDRLDDGAVQALSGWLADRGATGGRRGDANVIGSATKPSFISSVEACRATFGAASGYRQWRRRWYELDRYADEPGRRERVERVLKPTDD
jgi:hypothetical protein